MPAGESRLLQHGYPHARLMEESEARVEMAAMSRSPVDALVAERILNRPEEFSRWEAQHDRLMRGVSEHRRLPQQMVSLRATAFKLVHRTALFGYLRDRHVSGSNRRRLLRVFHRCTDYTSAVLAEHENYVRCSSSYLCTQHLAEHLMHDTALDKPLTLYEEWYREYFRAFCDLELAETEEEKRACVAQECLMPYLKHRVTKARKAILAMAPIPGEWREVQIRRRTGDTQELKVLVLPTQR